jgi:protein O-mannosyl-transferase
VTDRTPGSGSAADAAGRRAAWIAVWLPAIVAAAAYLPALRNGFALDDVVIVANNAALHHLSTLADALARPYWYDEGHLYRPLTTLAFGLEWAISHGHPLLFHAMNIVWHAGVSALVARLTLRWWPAPAALGAGLWFAIHPVHAEAVANVVGRSELVCAAALLGLALCAVPTSGADRDVGGIDDRPPSRVRLWVAGALAACAMASKETGVVAPALVWAAAMTPVPEDRRVPAVRQQRAARLAAAAAGGVACLLVARWLILGTLAGDAPHYAFELAPGWRGALLALATVPRALSLVLIPQPPRLDYSPPDASVLSPDPMLAALGALAVLAAIAVVWRHMRRPMPWSFVVCFAACCYAPVSNLMVRTGVVVADRTLYSPSVGVAIAAGVGIASAWTARRWVMLGASALVAGIGLVFMETALGAWRDSPTAFAAIRERSPTSYVGHYTSAEVRDLAGNPQGAQREWAIAVRLTPHNPAVLYMAATNAFRLRDTSRALTLLTQSVALRPTGPRARSALIGLDLRRGDTAAARTLLRDGLVLDSTQREWRAELQAIGG